MRRLPRSVCLLALVLASCASDAPPAGMCGTDISAEDGERCGPFPSSECRALCVGPEGYCLMSPTPPECGAVCAARQCCSCDEMGRWRKTYYTCPFPIDAAVTDAAR